MNIPRKRKPPTDLHGHPVTHEPVHGHKTGRPIVAHNHGRPGHGRHHGPGPIAGHGHRVPVTHGHTKGRHGHHGDGANAAYLAEIKAYEKSLKRVYGGGEAGYEKQLQAVYGRGYNGTERSYNAMLDRYYGKDYAATSHLYEHRSPNPHHPPAASSSDQPVAPRRKPHRKHWWNYL